MKSKDAAASLIGCWVILMGLCGLIVGTCAVVAAVYLTYKLLSGAIL